MLDLAPGGVTAAPVPNAFPQAWPRVWRQALLTQGWPDPGKTVPTEGALCPGGGSPLCAGERTGESPVATCRWLIRRSRAGTGEKGLRPSCRPARLRGPGPRPKATDQTPAGLESLGLRFPGSRAEDQVMGGPGLTGPEARQCRGGGEPPQRPEASPSDTFPGHSRAR
uniref:Uncharacterized protein n=1 Tax=Molossus molossus TaxID=27622 RepID=A0A7J8FAI0_MOLMO|nr:hypothetical protein HJG59_008521 [Molossus molossus]